MQTSHDFIRCRWKAEWRKCCRCGVDGGYSPDGEKIAYVPNLKWQAAWKRYRGGQTTPIYIVRLKDLQLERVPRQNSNDSQPVWFKDKVYFLSDRNGPVTLFSYDTKAKSVKQEIENKGLDFKSLSAGPDALVYEQFGAVYLYDPASGKSNQVHITVSADLPETRPHFEKAAEQIQNAGISPTGARAVFEAHGDIFTAPAEKGDVRNLTRTPGVEDRDPSWSPDGKSIAYFSDESGEYALHIVDQTGLGTIKKINLRNPPSFFYSPLWSPDSKKIAYQDKRLNLWYVDVEKGTPVKVATERFEDPSSAMNPTWSGDSKWLTYSKFLESHQHAICVYSVDGAKETQITDGTADSRYPVFDQGGKTLYFAASTDIGLTKGWLDLSSFQHPLTRNVYAVVLKKGDPNPVEPQSDEEKVAAKGEEKDAAKGKEADKDKGKEGDKKDAEKKDEPAVVTIDFEGIGQRIVAMPIRAANYVGLNTGKAGILFVQEIADVPRFSEPPMVTVSKFDLSTRKTEPYIGGVSFFAVSANGEKSLFKQGPAPASPWIISGTAAAPKPGEGALNLGDMEVYVEPRAEWNQMYREVWRIQRDFLYDPNHHGLNIPAAEKQYSVYLPKLGGRDDLNYLFTEMLGEVTIGHMFIGGGDIPKPKQVKGGLLGADYKVANGRYQFARVYDGENWNPDLRAPLTQPGVDVKVGEYLLEVNGKDVKPPVEVYSFFENTAGEADQDQGGTDGGRKECERVDRGAGGQRIRVAQPRVGRG